MSNQDHTFTAEYKEHAIAVLALKYENGWIIEVKISGNNCDIPKWRDHDNCYRDIDDARSAGMRWANACIDEMTQLNR